MQYGKLSLVRYNSVVTRREFSALMLGGAARILSTYSGVAVGAQTFSFRELPLNRAIAAMRDLGLGYAELSQRHVLPTEPAALKQWRTSAPLEEFRHIRKRFDDAGIVLCAYTYGFRANFTDAEIAHGFEMAKALGVDTLNTSANVSMAARIEQFAATFKMRVGFHNHASMAPNEFSTPEDFRKALQAGPKHLRINLDIGHFTAAGFDPVSFLEQNAGRITTVHIKDRKRNTAGQQGENVPFGQGDTPFREVLRLMKTKQYKIPALIEYEYKGADPIVEVRRCFDYIKEALA